MLFDLPSPKIYMRKLLTLLVAFCVLLTACTPNAVREDKSLGVFFDSAQVKGCFGMFDNAQGSFTIYDLPLSEVVQNHHRR